MTPLRYGSVFQFSKQQIELWTRTRLTLLKDCKNPSRHAFVAGLLPPGKSLLDRANEDLSILRRRNVSYTTIAKRLTEITTAAVQALGKPFQAPVFVQRFEVTIQGCMPEPQYCPFSPEGDADTYKREDKICPTSSLEFTIRNQVNNKSIQIHGLVPHIIGEHHIFPPTPTVTEIIETLDLPPEDPSGIEADLEAVCSRQFIDTLHWHPAEPQKLEM